ncbi:hypothetical protein [Bizionia sp.]|uniref:hypothetical protein n=1 Tax=Bizionia sp. TaxID=1954480 RepID=UPI003A917210
MEQIKILFFVLSSFFGINDSQIAAEKTTVIISPKSQEIEIIQENLFTVIQSEKDTTSVLEQWKKLVNAEADNTYAWAKDLENFPIKNLTLKSIKKNIQPHLKLNYSTEKDLRVMGIWYNKEKNQFFINHIPQQNLKTTDGKLVENYWIFDGANTFSFTIEPFLQMPENYKKFKKPLNEIVNK